MFRRPFVAPIGGGEIRNDDCGMVVARILPVEVPVKFHVRGNGLGIFADELDELLAYIFARRMPTERR
jgi:hypothetical protein